MGFHLWIDGELAWAQGSYEYRPLGAAVISVSDLFKRRDFSSRRPPPRAGAAGYVGQFASLGHLNQELRRVRPARARPPLSRRRPRRHGNPVNQNDQG